MNYKLIITSLFSILFFSCSSPSKEVKQVSADTVSTAAASVSAPLIEKGKVVNPVVCVGNATQSYAAYLPSYYNSTKKYPILFAFDAHAGGRIPVEAYKDLCKKYGYIIVASNNSKNGLDAATLSDITGTFMNDVKQRLSINENRIYLTGFSGGARVASSIAMNDGAAGLACCSAGFQPGTALSFCYIGFAGSEDFNSNEMIQLDEALNSTPTPHQLILYDGKHDWPTAEVFEDAFVWFEMNAMKKKVITRNDGLINAFEQKQNSKIKMLQSKSKSYEGYMETKKTVRFLDGLKDCSSFKLQITTLEKASAVQKTIHEKNNIEKREAELQNYYREALQSKDLNWWNKEVDNLQAQLTSKQNSHEEFLMYKRTLSFLSLLAYMASNSALNGGQMPQAAMYLQLYQKVDPTNAEVYYLQAALLIRQQNYLDAMTQLNLAADNGFTDIERLEKDPAMAIALQSPQYPNLVKKMQSKK